MRGPAVRRVLAVALEVVAVVSASVAAWLWLGVAGALVVVAAATFRAAQVIYP